MKNVKSSGQENYGKYLIAGILTAALIVVCFLVFDRGEEPVETKSGHLWSAETDSLFVKDCYQKYKSQVKDDMVKQETTKKFCKCMLEKVKSVYGENEMSKVKDSEIKKWDAECREQILNTNTK